MHEGIKSIRDMFLSAPQVQADRHANRCLFHTWQAQLIDKLKQRSPLYILVGTSLMHAHICIDMPLGCPHMLPVIILLIHTVVCTRRAGNVQLVDSIKRRALLDWNERAPVVHLDSNRWWWSSFCQHAFPSLHADDVISDPAISEISICASPQWCN